MKKKRTKYIDSQEEKALDSIDRVLNKYFLFIENQPSEKWKLAAKKSLDIIRRIVKPRKAERV
jgi:hypothetical protein